MGKETDMKEKCETLQDCLDMYLWPRFESDPEYRKMTLEIMGKHHGKKFIEIEGENGEPMIKVIDLETGETETFLMTETEDEM